MISYYYKSIDNRFIGDLQENYDIYTRKRINHASKSKSLRTSDRRRIRPFVIPHIERQHCVSFSLPHVFVLRRRGTSLFLAQVTEYKMRIKPKIPFRHTIVEKSPLFSMHRARSGSTDCQIARAFGPRNDRSESSCNFCRKSCV